jgi:hypothetical protein
LKLDFEKAFDTIVNAIIWKMMERLGFSSTWVNWVQWILASGSTSVFSKWCTWEKFQCIRGVRQGDPLSPLLFVLAVDCYNALLIELTMKVFSLYPLVQTLAMISQLSICG